MSPRRHGSASLIRNELRQRAEKVVNRGTGRSSVADDDEEDFEARERSRAAATHATEAVAKQAAELRRQTALQLEQERQEHAANQHKRRETYQQREKRKRDMGQQKKSKNYVEEEKRLLRQHNVYSGFDN